MTNEVRKAGRPVDGPLQISAALVGLLPAVGSANEYASILGVSYPTIRNWIAIDGAPGFKKPNGRYILRRDEFIAWLKEKGRVSV